MPSYERWCTIFILGLLVLERPERSESRIIRHGVPKERPLHLCELNGHVARGGRSRKREGYGGKCITGRCIGSLTSGLGWRRSFGLPNLRKRIRKDYEVSIRMGM